MVTYIIGFILIIITLIIIGLILRKRIYDRVDQLEAWKMDIMHRNVSAELQRVKSLKLSGETQEKFEAWKETWDRILTRELPDIEEYLFDAEESADRFKVQTAKRSLNKVEQTLNEIEETIESMYQELDDLLDSEKQSRKEVEKVVPKIKELRHLMLQDRHLFGKAEVRFEKEINEQQNLLDQFYQASDEGNYYEARQIVQTLNDQLSDLSERIEAFPVLYKKCNRELPDQVNQLRNGIREMTQNGYPIDEDQYLSELDQFDQQLKDFVDRLIETDDASIYEAIESMEERIQEIYTILEQEVHAKKYVDKHLESFKTLIEDVLADFNDTDLEVKDLQQTYYLEGSDLELYNNLDKWIHQLERQAEQMIQDLSNGDWTYVAIQDQLKSSYQDLEKFKESHQEFKDQVRTIRKDELAARDKVKETKKTLLDIERRIRKSNLPGVPSSIWNRLDEAKDHTQNVVEKLEEQPLDMGQVSRQLEKTNQSVEDLIEQTEFMMEQAYLVERVIQYANRYRTQYPVLSAKLSEAEKMFRDYYYKEALETASEGLEEVEPGALQRLKTRVEISS
ncbi:septation ring formation regulator [Pelagirhabdus alkalitolerans]|uniref:Septation ring formation regulator EzrA n=1 Tax=Pelagirhabdus alkalitolerans TaxID=1612202 RepID=A0A1G6HK39_9BACI|nr:septation ring formation regulator EzrA [Pelagirhabdus alkalitolerans]SDB94275.1 septation ring formation regulator [Pelagirhabdus alkalitolerans]